MTWCKRSCAAPAVSSASPSRRRRRSSSTHSARWFLAIPGDLRGLRDRTLLLVGWAAALRRSELVALEVADMSFEPEGVVLTIRRSKTDREGAGATVAVPFGAEEATCPVGALRRWLETAAMRGKPNIRGTSGHLSRQTRGSV
jgi:integrase